MDRRLGLYAPRFLLEEFQKYFGELVVRSGLRQDEALSLSKILLSRVAFVEAKEIEAYRRAAKFLVSDEKDEAYVACALAVGAELWSHDRRVRNGRIKCYSTKEILDELGAGH